MKSLKRPMLAASVKLSEIKYPVYVSAKIDGIRGLVTEDGIVSRTLKPIPNRAIQTYFKEKPELIGLDGELTIGPMFAPDVYRKTVQGCMSHGGVPKFTFHYFDLWNTAIPYNKRLSLLPVFPCYLLARHPSFLIKHEEHLLKLEYILLQNGAEGLILRSPFSMYKQGRSTLREAALLKYKHFLDSEAEILDIEELMENNNPAFLDERGYTARTTHRAHKTGRKMLGALVVQDLSTNVIFKLGTGFTEAQRIELWNHDPRGYIVKYKYLNHGVKDKPRHPVFLGFRDKIDI